MKSKLIAVLCTIALMMSLELQAATVNELAAQTSKHLRASEFTKATLTGGKLIDLLLSKKDFKNAFKVASMFARATNPSIAEYGMYKESNIYYQLYKERKVKKILVMAGAKLYGASQSKEAGLILSMYAKEYGVSFEKYFNLVAEKAQKNQRQRMLYSAMAHLKNGRWQLSSKYVEKGILPINTKKESDGTTLLHMAIWYNNFDAVKEFIEKHNADINIKDKAGDGPLKYAKHKKLTHIANYLRKKGAY